MDFDGLTGNIWRKDRKGTRSQRSKCQLTKVNLLKGQDKGTCNKGKEATAVQKEYSSYRMDNGLDRDRKR